MQKIYTDKEVLGDGLGAQKNATTLYNMYSNECVHEGLRGVLLRTLDEEHTMQQEVFTMMHDKGFYPTPEAEQKKVDEARQKFTSGVKQ